MYFNWQFARDHGVVAWVLLGGIVPSLKAAVWPYFAYASFVQVKASPTEKPGGVAEYVDNVYQFAFQFPTDWKMQQPPAPGEAGEVRAWVRHASKPLQAIATVGQVGRSITRSQFETSSVRDTVVEKMIELTVEQVYRKTSRVIGAEHMIVSERRAIPSDVGITFYISTAHRVVFSSTKKEALFLMSGIHVQPFEKPHLISFTIVAPVDKAATADNETMTKMFNSFHLLNQPATSSN